MKILTTLTILPSIFANNSTLLQPSTRKLSLIFQMLSNEVETNLGFVEFTKNIRNYGCHCFPQNSGAAGGFGPAQDPIDQHCQNLARCHKCIEMDYENEIEATWDADIGKYKYSIGADGIVDCSGNREQKREDLCECDKRFAIELGKTYTDSMWNDFFWLGEKENTGKFQYEAVCVRGTGIRNNKCCGSYPGRFPYDDSMKSCCADTTVFNEAFQECCASGLVAPAGTC